MLRFLHKHSEYEYCVFGFEEADPRDLINSMVEDKESDFGDGLSGR